MRLAVSGHPLHTRSMHVRLSRCADGKFALLATHLDLRKHGFVPVSGDLQESGIIHDMRIAALLDPDSRVLESVRASMPTVAIEPSSVTRGETCRDVAGRLSLLEGVALDGDYVRRLRAGFGGRLGCSHLLTLAQVVGPTVAHALDVAAAEAMDWRRGGARRLFCRTITVDGHEAEGDEIQLAAQLLDLYFRDVPPLANPMDRFVREHQVRALARFAPRSADFAELRVGERVRRRESLDVPWRERADVAEAMRRTPLFGALMRVAAERFGDGEDRPLCDLLQSLPGTFLQVMGARSDTWGERVAGLDTVVGISGLPDSCYMWRSDGALHAARKGSDPQLR